MSQITGPQKLAKDALVKTSWPRLVFAAWALIVGLAILKAMVSPNKLAGEITTPLSFMPAVNLGVEVPINSRGSVAHDGVDHTSVLTPPLKEVWAERINVGVVGGGLAEPAVDATGIYVGSDSGWVHALTHQGSSLWKFFDTNANGGISGAPVLDSQSVYLGTTAGNLYALEKRSGTVRWMHRFDGSIWSAPVLFDDSVYAMVSSPRGTSFLIRARRADGTIEWQSDEIKAPSVSGPAIDRVSGLVFVGAGDRRLHAFSITTGRSAWSRELDADVEATPTLIAGTLFVATRGEFVYSLKTLTGDIAWKTLVSGGSKASVTWDPSNNLAIVGTNRGMLYAFNRHSGKPRWVDRTGTLFSGMAGATSISRSTNDQSARLIWTTCADDTVCALEPKAGKIAHAIKMQGPVVTSPVVYKNALYLVESTGSLRKFISAR